MFACPSRVPLKPVRSLLLQARCSALPPRSLFLRASIVTSEGSGYLTTAPFNNVCRYQQLYDASQFLPLRTPKLITQIAFRPDSSQTSAINHTLTNIQFNLS